jgi:hypothetical protein
MILLSVRDLPHWNFGQGTAFMMILPLLFKDNLPLCSMELVPCSFLLEAECLSVCYEAVLRVGLRKYDHSNSKAILMLAV